jgi:hypothetical protein
MNDDLFSRRPWTSNFEGIAGMPAGMLGHFEASLLYHLAREAYRGYGEIVDAGAFLGASSYCLLKGLEDNAEVSGKVGRIHAYDLFQVWSEPGGTDAAMATWLEEVYRIKVAGYESTVGVYTGNLGPLARNVRIHPGDILQERWSGRPIEILFIDICKALPVWQHVLRIFFPSLINRVSLVVHQDWHHPWVPYLIVAQEALADYFELVVPKANDSTVFRLIDRIPERVLARVAAYEFSPEQERELMDRAIARFAEVGQSRYLRLAKAELLRLHGLTDEASRVIHETVGYHGEEMTPEDRAWFEANATGVATRLELQALGDAPSGFEAAYLAKYPDVVPGVEAGVFRSGHHHWFRHGRWEGRRV